MENLRPRHSPEAGSFYSPASSRTMSGEAEDIDAFLYPESDLLVPNLNHTSCDQGLGKNDQSSASEGGDGKSKKRGRKGHSKSRRGCFNCKKARIKCKENRPACDYCTHRGLHCEWPDIQMITHKNQGKEDNQVGPAIRNTMQLAQIPLPLFQSEAPVFTMQDFRLFNHFIQSSHPNEPIGNESVWTHEVPSLAADHDFLLHSMLALSAQELAEATPQCNELQQTALSYRVKAMTALNAAISNPSFTMDEGNAMLATCYILVFQSALLEYGLIDFMSFIRGIVAVAIHMGTNKLKFVFANLFDQEKTIHDGLKEVQLIDPSLARGACRSLEKFFTLVKNPRETEYYGYLLSASRDLFTSSADANANLHKIYALFCYHMSHEEFSKFVDPNNEAGKLLQSHFAALQLIMTPISSHYRHISGDQMTAGDGCTVRWLTNLHRKIHPDFREFYEWPLDIERRVYEGTIPLQFEETMPVRFEDTGELNLLLV